jgi:osmotically-inducible protein OsmY
MRTAKKSGAATRTDAQITRDVLHRMKADLDVPDDRIRVKVAGGVVTIEGTANHDSQKAATESCARSVKGVRSVINKIEVTPSDVPVEAQ